MSVQQVAVPIAHAKQTAQLGMWVFIASEWLFFGGLLAAYGYGRLHWPHGFGVASQHTDVVLGTINTGILLTSSALAALAVATAEHGRRHVGALLAAVAVLGVVFLCIKGVEYRKEWTEHLFPGPRFALREQGAELFFMLYFLMTGVHALHLTVGVAVFAVFAGGALGDRPFVLPRRLDTAALYWHFVDVVWIFLYPLLYLVERYR